MKTKELLKIPIESAKLEWTELALRAEGIKCFISARVIGDEEQKNTAHAPLFPRKAQERKYTSRLQNVHQQR